MTDIITIPLNKLELWDGNVRKTGALDGIAELKASIAAHGLLQSLVVRKGKRGKFGIVAGQRRYLALKSLAKDGRLAKDYEVPCRLADDDIDASELSLAENVMRAPMHPADQFEAFRDLIDRGASIADVAARFGVSETIVTRRLRLGRLSPVILDAYRSGDIGLDEAQAFAVTDDREAQERVFADLDEWNRRPDTIRRALTADEVPTSDKRVRFVGVEAYRQAGGVIRQDLFSESDTGYLQDPQLLDRLVQEKLRSISDELSAEGWRWVEIVPDADYRCFAGFQRRHPEHVELSDDQQEVLERLTTEYDDLVDTDEDANVERLEELQQQIDALTARTESWPAETRAIAGAIVSLGYDGAIEIERGLVRKEDVHLASAGDPDGEDVDQSAPQVPTGLSPKLVEDLTAQKSAAIAVELMGKPDIALAAVVHALAVEVFHMGYRSESCLDLSLRIPYLKSSMAEPASCKALAVLEQERERFADHILGNPARLWTWCLDRSRDELLGLLAFIAAISVNAVRRKADSACDPRYVHADALAEALSLDMTGWFTPTAEGYFSRINRAQMLTAIDEAKGAHAPSLEKLKKAELAARAEDLVAGTGWLPEPLRIAVNDNDADRKSEAAE